MSILSRFFGRSTVELRQLVGKLDPVGKYYLLSQLNGRRPVQKWTTPMVPSDAELAERVEASEVQFTLLRHFDPGVYRKQLAAAADGGSRASRLSSSIDLQTDWLEHGRQQGLVFAALPERAAASRKGRAASFADLVEAHFDQAWYGEQLRALGIATPPEGLLNHYLQAGCLVGMSPNSWFDEKLYLARNLDVLDAVLGAKFRCGFDHYVAIGEQEGRKGQLSEQDYLNEIFPGLDRPVFLETYEEFESLVRPRLRVRQAPAAARPRLNYLIPRLGNDVMFGGLISFMEFIRALDAGFDVTHRFIITEDIANPLEVMARVSPGNPCHAVIARSELIKISDEIAVGPDDVFVAYNAKAAYMAQRLAGFARNPKFLYFVQEWESIFHSFGAVSSALDRSFALDCHLLFNSAPLREWFERLGLGANNSRSVFSHVLTRSDAPPVPRKNTLLAYLRPEGHAARNCFQVVILALRHLLQICPQARQFEFLGLGALTPGAMWLDPETELQFLPKMPLADYAALLSESKVGVSLMNAPHPSVVPYEMAQFGLHTVTNVYANRPAEFIRAQSRYLQPCELDYKSVAEALARAVVAALDEPGVYCQLDHPASWDQAFAPAFEDIGTVFSLPR
jgi:hypothetical protein